MSLKKLEGAGNAGRPMHPQPRVEIKKPHELVTTGTPQSTGIPRAMVLTVSFVLSSATGLSCHRRLQIKIRRLDTSVGVSGPHDFSVREQGHSSRDLPRPPHPLPNVLDDRETPLVRARDSVRCAADLGSRSIRAGCGRLARRANQLAMTERSVKCEPSFRGATKSRARNLSGRPLLGEMDSGPALFGASRNDSR